VLAVLEVLGVLAFAASGIIEAARKRLDVFGVVLIAAITAFGGGTMRDLILGNKTFFWITHEYLVWTIIGIGVVTPLFFRARHIEITQRAIEWPDAIGLGLFATSGAQLALDKGCSPLVAALMAVVTCVFGGIIRDVLVNEIPRAVNDHQPYALFAFGGAWLMWGAEQLNLDHNVAVLGTAAVIIAARFMAIIFKCKLPAWRL
jgi:uncharacterized membrane protein YeiH